LKTKLELKQSSNGLTALKLEFFTWIIHIQSIGQRLTLRRMHGNFSLPSKRSQVLRFMVWYGLALDYSPIHYKLIFMNSKQVWSVFENSFVFALDYCSTHHKLVLLTFQTQNKCEVSLHWEFFRFCFALVDSPTHHKLVLLSFWTQNKCEVSLKILSFLLETILQLTIN